MPELKSLIGIHFIFLTFVSFEGPSEKSDAIQHKYQKDSGEYLYTVLRQFDPLVKIIIFEAPLKLVQVCVSVYVYILNWIHRAWVIEQSCVTLEYICTLALFISKVLLKARRLFWFQHIWHIYDFFTQISNSVFRFGFDLLNFFQFNFFYITDHFVFLYNSYI